MAIGIRTTAWLAAALLIAGCPSGPDKRADEKPAAAAAEKREQKQAEAEQAKAAEAAFERAVAAYRAQKKAGRIDYDDLLSRFRDVLAIAPDMAEAHYNLGCTYEAMRDDEKALEHYKRALQLEPDLHLAAANLGALLARNGQLDDALNLYQKALSKDAKNSPVLLNMAAIYEQQKKYDQAIQRASEVLVRDPSNVGAYRVMASVYYSMGKFDMARLICLRGLKIKKDDPKLLNTLGLVLLKLDEVPDALAKFRAALAQQPDMVPTRFNIAKVALDYKDFRVARAQFQKILEYEPGNKRAELGLAIAARGTGDFDAAREQFEALAERYPKDPVPRQWLCRLALRNFSDPHLAKKECGRCLKIQGRSVPEDHPCLAMYKEAKQGIEMEKKIKEMEAKAREEQKRREQLLARLRQLRIDTIDQAWQRAEKECQVRPPKKLDGAKLEFVLDPLAVTPDRKTKVELVGAEFGDVARVNVGTLKVKWRKIDDHKLQIVVPKGLELGPWDVLVTRKDKSELFFGGGLWVGEQPKCEQPEEPKKREETEKAEKTDKSGGPAEAAGPGAEPAASGDVEKKDGAGTAAPPPGEAGAPEAKPAPKQEDEPKNGEPGEPREPQEPAAPAGK
jgi:tetratricopeptide (TPR) repeat protein